MFDAGGMLLFGRCSIGCDKFNSVMEFVVIFEYFWVISLETIIPAVDASMT